MAVDDRPANKLIGQMVDENECATSWKILSVHLSILLVGTMILSSSVQRLLCVVCCEREDCLVVERGRWREGFGGRERRYSTSTTTLVSIGVGASSSEKHYSG